MSDKKYWQSFAELKDTEGLLRKRDGGDEFGEELPFEDLDGKGLLDAKTPRRDFLKYLGFSTAAATIAASCKQPVRKAIPYVNRPENITPGVPKYYASTFVQDGDAVPVLVKVRDGRPIKIEGNNLSFTGGGTSAAVQASVLDLYDMYRLPHPKRKVSGAFQEIPSFDQLDTQVAGALASAGPVVLLTSTIVSPSTQQIITDFLAKYPGSRHVQYDAMSYSGMLLANEATHGKRAIPAYRFDKAKVIVSLGADFLGTWLSSIEYRQQYAKGRRVADRDSEGGNVPQMNKHYQFESYLSMTGANADERFTHRPSETGAVAAALLAAVSGGTAPVFNDAKLTAGLKKVAADLIANKGAGLVIANSNDPNVQVVVNAINNSIGAYGNTISPGISLNYRQGIDKDFVALVDQMAAGQVGALLICGANPAYDYFDAAKFKTALQKVKLTVSFNEKMDETTELCQYAVPTHHYLESWGDAEPVTGFISFLQPTIFPLFKTRPFQTSLLKWSGNNTDYETYFRTYWIGKLGSQEALDKALENGFLGKASGGTSSYPPMGGLNQASEADSTSQTAAPAITPATSIAGPFNGGGVGAALAALSVAKKETGTEVVLYQQVSVGTGKQSGNPWLLELPDPVTRATWDNVALISTSKAKELGIDYESNEYEYYTAKPQIEITVNNIKKTLPVLVLPGMNKDTIAIAVGYGRSAAFAKATEGTGQNVYDFARFNGTTIDFYNTAATSAKAVGTYEIAQIQKHNSYEGRI
jgi:MoCo/4Fe-4S cofactor protein with predicted Tat translocation signal